MDIEHEIYDHELDLPLRKEILTKQRIVVKIGSSSLMHPETGRPDLNRMEVLVRELCNLRNSGKEVVLVTSGAIGVGGCVAMVHKWDIRARYAGTVCAPGPAANPTIRPSDMPSTAFAPQSAAAASGSIGTASESEKSIQSAGCMPFSLRETESFSHLTSPIGRSLRSRRIQ